MAWREGISDEGGYARYGESPYYDPPAGWAILAEYDWAGSYEFAQIVIWRNVDSGELRAAADTGCSCPTPFSDLTLDGMKILEETDDLRPLVDDLGDWRVEWGGSDPGLAELAAAVHRSLREARR